MKRRHFLAAATTGLAAPAIGRAQGGLKSDKTSLRLVTLSHGLVQPWSLAFLPDGRMLITERPGRLRVFANGRLEPTPLAGVPRVAATGQGGLLDVCLHPAFAQNRVLYLSYSAEGAGGNATTIARAELGEGSLQGLTVIFEAVPRAPGGLHFGSRIVFDRAGLMYVSTGERYNRPRAQNLGDLGGKIVRLTDDGTVPPDNPFVGRAGAKPEIWSYGHRNAQGLAVNPASGKLWEHEHGPRGGDEINIHGIDYDGSIISPNKSLPGMEDPLRVWTPSISPCGLCFYTGDKFPAWQGSLYTRGLSAYALFRLELDGERVIGEERLIEGRLPYIRDVRQGPDGLLYLVTHSDDGGLFRLDPA
ncbi:MAG: PQQ-dependent sugar dehydrogenase [Alphaproteobacteria bacterium]|nr:MAG: PQQ-dependent sugar dehydrogenase [Alphaproteobacteria bacterium]